RRLGAAHRPTAGGGHGPAALLTFTVPAISVIVPTYNCAPYLPESLDSVLEQTARDFEVVVVDDGSTDDTAAVLRAYEGRVRIVGIRHGGLSAARNAGLEQARGQWIAFHDADDVALPDRLAFQLAFLAGRGEDEAIFCNGERMGDGPAHVVPEGLARRCDGRVLDASDLFAGYPVYFQGALVPRRAFEASGPFDVSLPVQPDIEYGYRLLSRCRATFVNRVVFRYRTHGTNTSANRLGGREDMARILKRLLDEHPEVVRMIGRRRLRSRLARH